ncbi:MAG: porin family protein [Bacteroidales bacterium]
MKSKLLTLLVVLFFTGPLTQAQDFDTPFQFGFRIAPNLGWLKPDIEGYSKEGISAGFSWGFVAEYSLSQTYALCSGFSVTSNAGRLKYPYTEDTLIGTMNRKFKIRSIEIPLLLKMRTKEIGYFTYYGVIGFGTSFNMTARAEDEFNTSSPPGITITHEPDIKSRINFLRESLIVGLGAQYNISGDTQIFGGITFNNGFTNIMKGHNSVNKSLKESAISNYLELNVGVLF